MKKILVTLVACCLLTLTGCKKNPAEDYVGTYNLTASFDVTATALGMSFNKQKVEEGTLVITTVGEEGEVLISGLYNTTGYVNDDGELVINDCTVTVAVDGLPEIVTQMTGLTELNVPVKIPTCTTQLDNGKMSWNGAIDYETTVTDLNVTVYMKGTVNNVAVAQ